MPEARGEMAAAASLWALVFAAIHLMWAFGWYVGLDPVAAASAFARPWFLAYDIAVALGCFIVAGAFGVLAANRGGRRLRSVAHVVSVVAVLVVTLRAVMGLAALAWRGYALGGASVSGWDVWFVLGAALFVAAIRRRPSL